MASSAAETGEQQPLHRPQLARVNTHIYTHNQFTHPVSCSFTLSSVAFLRRSRAVYIYSDCDKGLWVSSLKWGRPFQSVGVPSDTWMGAICSDGSGDEEDEHHLHYHHCAHCSPSPWWLEILTKEKQLTAIGLQETQLKLIWEEIYNEDWLFVHNKKNPKILLQGSFQWKCQRKWVGNGLC